MFDVLPAIRRQPAKAWYLGLAAVALVGLLLAFHDVVSGAVRQGEMRRAALAARELATWRCSMLPGATPRARCLVALAATPPSAPAAPAER